VETTDLLTDRITFLLQRENKIDLQQFGGRVVKVSYAVATPHGISQYSPTANVKVQTGKPHK